MKCTYSVILKRRIKNVRHIISLLLENEAGALSRVSGLFSARGFNIESLSVAPTDEPTISRMTLVTRGTDSIIEQITKQLNKLVDVIKVIDISESPHIERELLLVKVTATPDTRDEVKLLVDIFRARIIDVTDMIYIIEATGTGHKLNAFLDSLDQKLIMEVVRSGSSGITRGKKLV